MKKTLLALMLGMFLFSCQKTGSLAPKPDEKKYDVTFTTGFSTKVTGFSTSKTKATNGVNQPLSGNIDNLYYRVYDSTGLLINSIDQASPNAGFGVITDQLPAGTYSVFIAGSKGSLNINTGKNISYSRSFYQPLGSVWNDTFTNAFSVTVDQSAVSQAVSLNRTVGGIDITLTDAIPSNAAKITLIFSYYELAYYYNNLVAGANIPASFDFALNGNDVGTKNKVLSMFAGASATFNPTRSDLTIRAYDSSNRIIAEKTIANVPVYPNERTALTGALFAPASVNNQSVGFAVTVNTDWATPPSTITF